MRIHLFLLLFYLFLEVSFAREEDEEDYQERIEQQLANQDEEDLDKIKEESRKRRQAILEKYKQQQQQQPRPVESPSDDNLKGNLFPDAAFSFAVRKLFFLCALFMRFYSDIFFFCIYHSNYLPCACSRGQSF